MVYPLRKVPNGNSVDDGKQDVDLVKKWNQESKRKCSTAVSESEAQWQAVSHVLKQNMCTEAFFLESYCSRAFLYRSSRCTCY